jgi:hypothetical protein
MNYFLLLLIWAPIAFASSYPDTNELFYFNLVASLLIYVFFGIILSIFNKINSLHMLPFYIVLGLTVVVSLMEAMVEGMFGATFMGRGFFGALIPTAIYLFVVKKSLKNIDQSKQSESAE